MRKSGQRVNSMELGRDPVRVGRFVGLVILLMFSIGDSAEVGGAAVSEEAVMPVDLLLAEDLFPHLIPILHHAAEQAPSVLARNVDLAVADTNAMIANSERYPSVGGVLRYDYRREDRVDRPDVSNSNKLYYFFEARYPLYHWGAIKAASEIGRIGIEVAEGQLDAAYRTLIQSVRSQYLELVLRKIIQANTALELEKQRSDLEFLAEQLNAGEIAPNRVGSAGLNLDEAELRYEQSASYYFYLFRRFQRLVGDPDLTHDVVASQFPEVGHNPEHLSTLLSKFINGGFDDDPRVKAAELQIHREEQRYRIHNVRNRPKLNLTTGITQDEISYNANIADRYGTTALFAGISIQWSLFDGFETRGLKRASLLRLTQLRQNRRELDGQLLDDANQAADTVEFSARALRFGEIRYSGIKRLLDVAQADFESGVASEEAVESAKSRVRDAEVDLARRRSEYLNAVSNFLSLVGADAVAEDFINNHPELGPEFEQK